MSANSLLDLPKFHCPFCQSEWPRRKAGVPRKCVRCQKSFAGLSLDQVIPPPGERPKTHSEEYPENKPKDPLVTGRKKGQNSRAASSTEVLVLRARTILASGHPLAVGALSEVIKAAEELTRLSHDENEWIAAKGEFSRELAKLRRAEKEFIENGDAIANLQDRGRQHGSGVGRGPRDRRGTGS